MNLTVIKKKNAIGTVKTICLFFKANSYQSLRGKKEREKKKGNMFCVRGKNIFPLVNVSEHCLKAFFLSFDFDLIK